MADPTALTRDRPRTLLQIADDVRSLDDLLSELPDGVISPEAETALNEWFAQIEQNRDAKIDGYCALIREAELRSDARFDEADRLTKLAGMDENKAKRLKERLKLYFMLTSTKKVETPHFRLSLCGNGGKMPLVVNCTVDSLPPHLVRTTKAADIDAIRATLEAGIAVQGCELKPRGTSLRIS